MFWNNDQTAILIDCNTVIDGKEFLTTIALGYFTEEIFDITIWNTEKLKKESLSRSCLKFWNSYLIRYWPANCKTQTEFYDSEAEIYYSYLESNKIKFRLVSRIDSNNDIL